MIAAFILLSLNESKKRVERETILSAWKKKIAFYMILNTWCNSFFFFFLPLKGSWSFKKALSSRASNFILPSFFF